MIVLWACILAVVGAGMFVVWSAVNYFMTPVGEGFEISRVECEMGPTHATVFVALTMATVQDHTTEFRVERPETNDLSIGGVATLTANRSLASLDKREAGGLRALLDHSDRWGHVPANPSTIVVELRRAGPVVTDARLASLQLRWGAGELAFVQEVPVNLVLTRDSCSAGGSAEAERPRHRRR